MLASTCQYGMPIVLRDLVHHDIFEPISFSISQRHDYNYFQDSSDFLCHLTRNLESDDCSRLAGHIDGEVISSIHHYKGKCIYASL